MFDPTPLDLADALARAGLPAIHIVNETDSTNDLAIGRRGRSWFSPAGAGLYLSVVARIEDAVRLSLITLAAGVAAAEGVTTVTGLPVELKWPNDLVVGRPWRKLGGLLCEAVGVGGRVDAVVIGIGINLRVAAYPPEIADRATSIEAELGRGPDRTALVVACLRGLRERVGQLREGDHLGICSAWRRLARAGLNGAIVRWDDQRGARRGVARDIDEAGALVVDSDGGVERLVAGEVTWERLSRV